MTPLRSLTQFLILTLLIGSAAWQSTAAEAKLTNCIDVLRLSPEEANANRPVRIRGTVTLYVPASQLSFVQDESGGVYVLPSPWPRDLTAGDVVEVEGVTSPGRFSSIIQWGTFRRTGERATMTPKRIAIEELNSGKYDCQFVEIEGVVQSAERGNNHVSLRVATGGSSASVLIFDPDTVTQNWVDARVKLRGVAGTFYNGEQLTGFGLFLADQADASIQVPAPDPFSRPLRSTRRLAWYSPEGALDHRILMRGVVTVSWTNETFFINDETGSIRVSTVPGQPSPQRGDLVDVSGFVYDPTGPSPRLRGAVWRKTGSAPVPTPRPAGLAEVLSSAPNGELITVEGTIVSSHGNTNLWTLALEESGRLIHAVSKDAFGADLVNARAKITGAVSTAPRGSSAGNAHCLWLTTTNGVEVLSRAHPNGTSSSAKGSIALATAAAAILVAGTVALRARGRAQEASNRAATVGDQLFAAEKELTQLKEARERLGRDLHDHIIQSIYAVGLSIEDCRQMLNGAGGKEESTLAESRLKMTLADVNSVIRELRNVILGLETNAIQPQEFRTALKSLGLTLGHEKSSRVRLDIDQMAVDLLSAVQATELVHIAREAISNSVRHGKAQMTTISLHSLEQHLQFTIDDDGCGFKSHEIQEKGFGLRNMAKRAESIGAKFTFASAEGTGTRIVLDIPKQKQHFSSSESRSRINR